MIEFIDSVQLSLSTVELEQAYFCGTEQPLQPETTGRALPDGLYVFVDGGLSLVRPAGVGALTFAPHADPSPFGNDHELELAWADTEAALAADGADPRILVERAALVLDSWHRAPFDGDVAGEPEDEIS